MGAKEQWIFWVGLVVGFCGLLAFCLSFAKHMKGAYGKRCAKKLWELAETKTWAQPAEKYGQAMNDALDQIRKDTGIDVFDALDRPRFPPFYEP